ncbi:DUF3800 domain-containing protein [Tardiphaga sp. 709]|uniref:DUF3800 domain-containing protein n=1 Tax=Tardiphaga sp. 709 TaxID=3076039 RepID=UPI0028E2E07C|nr:DUF3800 domain-containing protein [Tardiphaga sp. 709]WNV10924.1 DUF3800 domain-containing protein [Tardiphaga sp. 709]
MLQAFIDDSGWDGNSPVFVLAGYVAKAEQWAAFSKEWQVILDRQEPSRIGVLKTKDIYRNRVPNTSFHGWTDDQRDARLKSFIEAINRYAMHGIVSVIPLEPYQRLMKGKFNPDILDRPYFLSFFGVIVNLLKLTHRLKLDDKLEIVFDTQDVDKALLTSEYEKCMAVAPPQVRELCVGMLKTKKHCLYRQQI